jgi:hypothetical protein
MPKKSIEKKELKKQSYNGIYTHPLLINKCANCLVERREYEVNITIGRVIDSIPRVRFEASLCYGCIYHYIVTKLPKKLCKLKKMNEE